MKPLFYIKLTEDKDLEITVREPIYRGEKLNGELIFLLPEQVDELMIEQSLVYLSYIRADGHADVVYLERLEEKYNETYFQFTLPITSRLTRFPGQMNVFLQIFSGDPVDPQIVKSGELCLTVEESPDMDQYFQADRFITALYQHDKRMKDEFERVDESIAENSEDIAENAEHIGENAEAIRQNTEAINENSQAIADNSEAIEMNAIAIGENSAAIRDNADAIRSAFGAIETNSADIAANRQAIADNSAAIAQNNAAIAQNSTAIAQNSVAIGQNADAIRANISAIAQINAILAQHSNDIGLLSDALANVSAELDGKADGLTYSIDTGVLQLTSGGNPIGNGVVIRTNGKLISTSAINDDGELVIYYTDGTSETLGKVVGENGKTYVPHIDEHHVISWTIEDIPPGGGDVPDPVDLNPDDEWKDISDDTSGKSDYTWDSI